MSTEYGDVTARRILKLVHSNEVIFHTSDLSKIWKIKNKNTLHTTLKRYSQRGLLNRIHKGMYSLYEIEHIDSLLLDTKTLLSNAYISCETALENTGIVFQDPGEIVLISSRSQKFSVGKNNYRSHKLQNRYLHNATGITSEKGSHCNYGKSDSRYALFEPTAPFRCRGVN